MCEDEGGRQKGHERPQKQRKWSKGTRPTRVSELLAWLPGALLALQKTIEACQGGVCVCESVCEWYRHAVMWDECQVEKKEGGDGGEEDEGSQPGKRREGKETRKTGRRRRQPKPPRQLHSFFVRILMSWGWCVGLLNFVVDRVLEMCLACLTQPTTGDQRPHMIPPSPLSLSSTARLASPRFASPALPLWRPPSIWP